MNMKDVTSLMDFIKFFYVDLFKSKRKYPRFGIRMNKICHFSDVCKFVIFKTLLIIVELI